MIDDPYISHPAYFPQYIRSPCIISCKRDVLLKLPSCTRQGPNLKITASSFQLFDFSKYHVLFNLLSFERLDLAYLAPSLPDSSTSHSIFQFIHSNLYRNQLISFIKLFRPRSSFTFYTDSSVQNISTLNINADIA